jgi:hypothetical protein
MDTFSWRARRTDMSTFHLHERSTATPEELVAALTDFEPGRSKPFGNGADNYLAPEGGL